MLTKLRTFIVASGLLALCAGPLSAENFVKYITSEYGNAYWNGSVVVPSAGWCAQIVYAPYANSWASSAGPLGVFSRSGPMLPSYNPQQTQGSVAAGTYTVTLQVVNGGHAAINITW